MYYWQIQSGVAVTEPANPKRFTICSFTDKVCHPWVEHRLGTRCRVGILALSQHNSAPV